MFAIDLGPTKLYNRLQCVPFRRRCRRGRGPTPSLNNRAQHPNESSVNAHNTQHNLLRWTHRTQSRVVLLPPEKRTKPHSKTLKSIAPAPHIHSHRGRCTPGFFFATFCVNLCHAQSSGFASPAIYTLHLRTNTHTPFFYIAFSWASRQKNKPGRIASTAVWLMFWHTNQTEEKNWP